MLGKNIRAFQAIALTATASTPSIGCLNFLKKKVLVPSMTFSATASAVLYNRLEPVFIDSDPLTLGLVFLIWIINTIAIAWQLCLFTMQVILFQWIFLFLGLERGLKIIETVLIHQSIYKGKRQGCGVILDVIALRKKTMTTGDGGMIVRATLIF